ncbi:TFIIH subunit [Cavenderia fasciculata]|uniref:General transcription factor IIH subunit n=1 Tax=Cavenderia fasciculata TaxID=261658 RepID=F4PQI4_CACFS|nr:TFIIH subunit [Cavenderia fasciculata]EGG22647.1 TFIIH subunit [Cavenderia fasciculata]|eukprot:XP_004360498.1 TFIIH subunit [Cavenderia fasciculata]
MSNTRRGANNTANDNGLKQLLDAEDGQGDTDHVLQTNDQGTQKYKWEEKFVRSWETIEEDEKGLRPSLQEDRDTRTRRQLKDDQRVRRGMQRHVCLVIDLSKSLEIHDLKPNRHQAVLIAAENFIKEFFDQNPISQLSLIITKNSKAEKISDLSSNPNRHIQLLKMVSSTIEGDPSIQNSLDVSIATLSYVPKYGSREVIFIYSSLTTCDPGDLSKTITTLKNENIRVSFVHLAAELYVCRHISDATNGTMKVIETEHHLNEALILHCQPPPTIGKVEAALVEMGFPQQHTSQTPMMCVCHEQFKYVGYTCPRCQSKFCELPTDCQICGLSLVSSPHLARSYHHLFQVPIFREVNPKSIQPNLKCYGCLLPIKPNYLNYGCPRCKKIFCFDCDQVVHESIHNCPGCENGLEFLDEKDNREEEENRTTTTINNNDSDNNNKLVQQQQQSIVDQMLVDS